MNYPRHNTPIGQATNLHDDGRVENVMYDLDGMEIGNSESMDVKQAFFKADGTPLNALKPDWETYAAKVESG